MIKKLHVLKRNKTSNGFTLVELIVVLIILALLAAIIVPALTGYIDKAKKAKAIGEARNIVTAAQASAVEAYAAGAQSLQLNKSARIDGTNVKVGGLSNTAMANLTGTNSIDKAIAASILKYADSAINVGAAQSGGDNTKPFGRTGKEFISSIGATYGIFAIYTAEGTIALMQIYHDGVLVTYALGHYAANSSSDAKFLSKGERWSNAFTDAGLSDSEIDASLKNSYFYSW